MNRRLSLREQKEVLDRIVPLIGRSRHSSSLASVFSGASPQIALLPLLTIMAESWNRFDDWTKHQCIYALGYHMCYGHNDLPYKRFLKIVRRLNPRALVASARRARDSALRDVAARVLPELDAYLVGRSTRSHRDE